MSTIRLKLLKIGAVITRNTTRVRIWFSSAFPLKDLFRFCLAASTANFPMVPTPGTY